MDTIDVGASQSYWRRRVKTLIKYLLIRAFNNMLRILDDFRILLYAFSIF